MLRGHLAACLNETTAGAGVSVTLLWRCDSTFFCILKIEDLRRTRISLSHSPSPPLSTGCKSMHILPNRIVHALIDGVVLWSARLLSMVDGRSTSFNIFIYLLLQIEDISVTSSSPAVCQVNTDEIQPPPLTSSTSPQPSCTRCRC